MAHGWDQDAIDALQQRRQQGKTVATAIAPKSTTGAKYRNTPVFVDLGPAGETINGHLRLVHLFQSRREADYYAELRLRRQAGDLLNLRLQEPFALIARASDGTSQIVGEWLADFTFDTLGHDGLGATHHVVDAKGVKTHLYLLKKKIVEACHGITIEEV